MMISMMFLEPLLINFQTRRKDEMKSVLGFKKAKANREKISMVTCYDYTLAKIINSTDIDCILVGDSGGMVLLGKKYYLYNSS